MHEVGGHMGLSQQWTDSDFSVRSLIVHHTRFEKWVFFFTDIIVLDHPQWSEGIDRWRRVLLSVQELGSLVGDWDYVHSSVESLSNFNGSELGSGLLPHIQSLGIVIAWISPLNGLKLTRLWLLKRRPVDRLPEKGSIIVVILVEAQAVCEVYLPKLLIVHVFTSSHDCVSHDEFKTLRTVLSVLAPVPLSQWAAGVLVFV